MCQKGANLSVTLSVSMHAERVEDHNEPEGLHAQLDAQVDKLLRRARENFCSKISGVLVILYLFECSKNMKSAMRIPSAASVSFSNTPDSPLRFVPR